ncbi:MAG: outer membrane beta-barrel protein [Pseudomonadota bacterium]
MTKINIVAALGASALSLTAASASAQDWSGFYMGAHAGYQALSDTDNETIRFDTNLDGTYGDTVRTSAAVDAFSPGFCSGKPNGDNAGAGCSDDQQGTGEFGLRAGYDIQSGSFVFGVVAEGSTGGLQDRVTAFSTTPANYVFLRETQYVIAARARLGMAYGRYLPYVTAGYALARVESEYSSTNTANAFVPTAKETDATGFQVGAGIETKVTDRISLGVEYLYSDLEEDEPHTVRAGPGTAPLTNPFRIVNPLGTDQRRSSDAFELHSVRLTAAIRF